MDIKELLPKDTEGRLRIIQETVPGRQITLAHVITSPKPIVYRKLGLNPDIDFDRIREIHAKTNAALVLHGGTGVSDSDLRRAIEAGISKINVGTELWYNGYGNTMKKYAEQMPYNSDPRKVMAKVREACREIVLKKIEIFGSAGRETGGASV